MEWTVEPIDLNGRAQGPALAIFGVGASVSIDVEGTYDIWTDTDCFIKVIPTITGDAADVTTDTGYPLWSGNIVTLWIGAKSKLGGVTSGASGTIRYHKVG